MENNRENAIKFFCYFFNLTKDEVENDHDLTIECMVQYANNFSEEEVEEPKRKQNKEDWIMARDNFEIVKGWGDCF